MSRKGARRARSGRRRRRLSDIVFITIVGQLAGIPREKFVIDLNLGKIASGDDVRGDA